jgi:hypothetical protein
VITPAPTSTPAPDLAGATYIAFVIVCLAIFAGLVTLAVAWVEDRPIRQLAKAQKRAAREREVSRG